jgi:hypothetical protein
MGRVRTPVALAAVITLGTTVLAPTPLQARQGPVEIPLSVDGGWLVVPVETADGATLRFALHTAIPATMVSERVGGADPSALGLSLAGSTDPFADLGTVPDAALTRDGVRIDGFLGLQTLGDVDVLLDAPGGRMLLKPIGRRVEWPGYDLAEPSRMRIYHGVALRTEIEVGGTPFSATLDLAGAANTATEGVARTAAIAPGAPATVRIGSASHALTFTFGSTPILDRWDPDGAGFVAFGAALAADCVLAISYVHQELRTCVR